MNLAAGLSQYQLALKQGQKTYRDCVHTGRNPYLPVLDEFLSRDMIAGYINIGTIEIPTEYIIGTKTIGRKDTFAADFMPLMPYNTEFARKWASLCADHLGSTGIRDPIICFEYLGRFFVQEGNKRVSVLKSFNAVTIPAQVTRIMPVWRDSVSIRSYYEFLQFFKLSGLYQVRYNTPGQYQKLQSALGFEADHIWTNEERSVFKASFSRFSEAYNQLSITNFRMTVSEAFLTWIKVYPYSDLNNKSVREIQQSLAAIWSDVETAVTKDAPIALDTEASEPEKGIIPTLMSIVRPSHLNVAFIYQKSPGESRWVEAHDNGRRFLEETLGDKVKVSTYTINSSATTAYDLMTKAVADGAQVIFSTSQLQIGDCRRFAAEHPQVKLLNCSLYMPFTGFRTYYCRTYQAKFLAGAIAGSLTRDDKIGYVANLPTYGVPADINAFALGARLTNPTVRIEVKWACLEPKALETFDNEGIRVVSNLDTPTAGATSENRGLTILGADGKHHQLLSPYMNWGILYEHVIQSILDGSWENTAAKNGIPINYWWGMRSNVMSIIAGDQLPEGAAQLLEILRTGIVDGTIDPFRRPLTDQNGHSRSDGSHWFSPDELMKMDWLCNCIDGTIPEYDEIPGSVFKSLVRLQGLHREQIPAVPQEVIL